jgi:hypothetical protein
MTEGYCVKCRTKREIKGATAVTLKNGRPQKALAQPVVLTCSELVRLRNIITFFSK